MDVSLFQLGAVAGIGLAAGLLGGLAGVGGSMVILPGLFFLLGEARASTHHVYMAAAMAVNFAVSLPASIGHYRRGYVRTDLLPILLVSTAVLMVVGVVCSNLFSGTTLRNVLAGFIGVYCVYNLVQIVRNRGSTSDESKPGERGPDERITTPRLLLSGGGTGFVGGMLGLGGGVLQVPALQMLCRVPLKQAIATSSAVICVTAVIGAGAKLLTLPGEGESPVRALMLAGLLAPTAIVGGMIGAKLTHHLPVAAVRVIITVLLMVVAARMSGLV